MESLNINNFIDKDIVLSLKGKNIILQFFDPGKFANIQLETDGKIILEEKLESNFAKTRLIPITRIYNASNVTLYLPNQYSKKINLEMEGITIKIIDANSDTKMNLDLKAQDINIKNSSMDNGFLKIESNNLDIQRSQIGNLNCKVNNMEINHATIKQITQVGMQNSSPKFTADRSTFDSINIYRMQYLYMDECKIRNLKATGISQLILSDTKCGDIDLKIGDIYLRNCRYQNNSSLSLENGNVKINTLETRNTILKSYLLKKKIDILVDNQKVYTINTTENVKIKKMKYKNSFKN